jgi:hypothetical protein
MGQMGTLPGNVARFFNAETRRTQSFAEAASKWHLVIAYSVAVSLFVLTVVGCGHAPQTNAPQTNLATGSAFQVWRSPDSSLQQRADAVNKLIPKGTSKEQVERILAERGIWTHYHGPTIDAIHNRSLPDHDYWRLDYEFPGGGVSLEFEPSTAFGDRFVRASPFQTLTTVPHTNSP